MGEVISLASRRRRRPAPGRSRPAERRSACFYFDLASPFTYLAVERVDRQLPAAAWIPTLGDALHRHDPWRDDAARAAAERRAAALRVPLVWPDRPAERARAAMRAAAYAAGEGGAAPFVIAASRLAFCGGFDLDDPEVLAEAAAAAGVGLEQCLSAARDPSRDGAMEAIARKLLASGADRLPALRVGSTIFAGEQRIAEAVAAARPSAVGGIPSAG